MPSSSANLFSFFSVHFSCSLFFFFPQMPIYQGFTRYARSICMTSRSKKKQTEELCLHEWLHSPKGVPTSDCDKNKATSVDTSQNKKQKNGMNAIKHIQLPCRYGCPFWEPCSEWITHTPLTRALPRTRLVKRTGGEHCSFLATTSFLRSNFTPISECTAHAESCKIFFFFFLFLSFWHCCVNSFEIRLR